MRLTSGAKIIILINNVMLEAVSRQPGVGTWRLGPVRETHLLHHSAFTHRLNTTLHCTIGLSVKRFESSH